MSLSERLRAKFTSLEVVREVEVLEAEIESLNRSLRVHMEGYLDAQADIERMRGLLLDVLATKQMPMWLRVEIKDALNTEDK